MERTESQTNESDYLPTDEEGGSPQTWRLTGGKYQEHTATTHMGNVRNVMLTIAFSRWGAGEEKSSRWQPGESLIKHRRQALRQGTDRGRDTPPPPA